MDNGYVIDTTSLISYFSDVFRKKPKISDRSLKVIDKAFNVDDSIKLSIPSIVFIELFEKWYKNEEIKSKIEYEVLSRIYDADNIEIKPIEREVMENFILIRDDTIKIDNHDKIILASAMMLQWPLITSDERIKKYNKKHKVIPKIFG